jgi:hypothetical protein
MIFIKQILIEKLLVINKKKKNIIIGKKRYFFEIYQKLDDY